MPFWSKRPADAAEGVSGISDLHTLRAEELVRILNDRLLSLFNAYNTVQRANLKRANGVVPLLQSVSADKQLRAAIAQVEEVIAVPAYRDATVADIQPYREWQRSFFAEGPYDLMLVDFGSDEFARSLAPLICVASFGMPHREADELVTRVQHIGPQLVVERMNLNDAVRIKEGLSAHCGFSSRIREGTQQIVRAEGTSGRKAIPEAVRNEVWRRDQGRCVDCGSRENLEYDHIIAVVNGGSNTARNIELRCESCNRRKGAKI